MPPSKKRKLNPPSSSSRKSKPQPKVEEINFDLSARQEYLTGFHKRKVARAKIAREKAVERERVERVEARKKMREDRKADLERHVREVNELLKPINVGEDGDGEDQEDADWSGIEDGDENENENEEAQPEPVDHEAEYVDEDKYTTVTVEAVDVTRDGLVRSLQDSEDTDSDEGEEDGHSISEQKTNGEDAGAKKADKKPPWAKNRDKDGPRKPRKKRNFRYEGKLERKASRVKQKRKNSEQAKARKGD